MDFDVDIALSRPIESSVPTRWERKLASQSTSTKTPSPNFGRRNTPPLA